MLSSLSSVLLLLRWENGRLGVAARWRRLKPPLFIFFFLRFPTPFYLLIPILAPKFSKYEPITLDLMKYKLKHGLPFPYASFTDLVRLDLLRPYVVLVWRLSSVICTRIVTMLCLVSGCVLWDSFLFCVTIRVICPFASCALFLFCLWFLVVLQVL